MSSQLSEFNLINTFFKGLTLESSDVLLGIGDDCAVVNIPHDMSLCLSLDTMVEGVHFLKNAPPRKIAYRALAAAMSDLAAMGAKPSHFTLSLTLPESDSDWLLEFSLGLKTLANRFNFPLVGGDTTRGPLTIGIQVHGLIPRCEKNGRSVLSRAGAQEGDVIIVTGTLGDAGAALALLETELLSEHQLALVQCYYSPEPRIEQGLQLRALASACIDISDGLVADAMHLAEQSGLRFDIDYACLPLSEALLSEEGLNAGSLALSAGDDYELLFTMSESNWQHLNNKYSQNIYTKIGKVSAGEGVVVQNSPKHVTKKGFMHFE